MVMVAQQHPEDLAAGRQKLTLWLGFAGAPLCWAAQMLINMFLVPVACLHGRTWPVHLCTGLFLLAAAACTAVAFSDWRRPWGRGTSDVVAAERTEFMGRVGAIMSLLFLLLIVAQAVPQFVFGPCES